MLQLTVKYEVIVMDSNNYKHNPDALMTFTSVKDGAVIGEFLFINGQLSFKGNVDASAKIFIDFLLVHFNKRLVSHLLSLQNNISKNEN